MTAQALAASSSLTELPVVFLPYQQRTWAEVEAALLLVIEKSRRTGFSWALAAIAAGTAAKAAGEGGMDVLYMGYEKEMTREFIDYVAEFAKSFQSVASEVQEDVFIDPDNPEKHIQVFRIKFASGFEVVALPSVARALRGKQGLVILDEAAFMDDLEEVLKAALALLMWGGRVVVVSTHNGETNKFNELINEIRAGRRAGRVMRLTFEEAVREGLCQRIFLVQKRPWSPEAEAAWVAEIRAIYRDNAAEELDVIPNPATGAYLTGALLDARADAGAVVLRWTAPEEFTLRSELARKAEVDMWFRLEVLPVLRQLRPEEAHALGEDFARVRDLSVFWLLAIEKGLRRRTVLVIELRQMPYKQQEQLLFLMLDQVPRFRAGIMDAGGNGGYLAEQAVFKYGERITALQLSEPWYRENMPKVKAALEDAMFTLPKDRDVQDDWRMLKLVRGVARIPERRLNAEKENRHGDAAIAGSLAYIASLMEPEEYGYKGAPLDHGDVVTQGRRFTMMPRDEEEDMAAAVGPRGMLPPLRGGMFGGR